MIEPTLNQYAPPVADVADVAPSSAPAELKMFSAKGRIGRLRYLAYCTGASIIHSLVAGVLVAMTIRTSATLAATIIPYLVLLWFTVIIGIKRCHDLNISGWWTLTVIIPVIALVWIFVPGSKTANRFGPPPPPNTLGVRVLGLILPFIFVIGIVAAVVLPAYSDYVKSKAAQQAGRV